MRPIRQQPFGPLPLIFWAIPMLGLLLLPLLALVVPSSPGAIMAGIRKPMFLPAIWLSAQTSIISLLLILLAGTPLAWWLSQRPTRTSRTVELLVDLPIVIPPAVVGIALLQTFGRNGLLSSLDLGIPFTTTAVVLAQVVVAAPFYIQSKH